MMRTRVASSSPSHHRRRASSSSSSSSSFRHHATRPRVDRLSRTNRASIGTSIAVVTKRARRRALAFDSIRSIDSNDPRHRRTNENVFFERPTNDFFVQRSSRGDRRVVDRWIGFFDVVYGVMCVWWGHFCRSRRKHTRHGPYSVLHRSLDRTESVPTVYLIGPCVLHRLDVSSVDRLDLDVARHRGWAIDSNHRSIDRS